MNNEQHPARQTADESSFALTQRKARALTASSLVPATYQGEAGLANAMIAAEIADRIGASPLMVMQNLHVIHGRPSWSSSFIIACINGCGRFAPLKYEVTGEGDDLGCVAWTTDKDGNRCESPRVTIGIAKAEGWATKSGSKWKTMPVLMLHYRAATLFGRLFAPELLMGLHTAEEVVDIEATPAAAAPRKSKPAPVIVFDEADTVSTESPTE